MEEGAIFELAQGTALRGLTRNLHLLDLVERQPDPDRLLALRLSPDQFRLAEQVRTVTIFALRCTHPVIERPWALDNWDSDAAALRTQIKAAAKEIGALTAVDFAGAAGRTIRHKAGDAILTQEAGDYLVQFAIPNLWFHLSMVYAVLRADGVAIGKADFDGLHAYPEGFSFTDE